MLAKLSDIIITINHEDYNRAKRFRYKKHGSAELIPGVGVDLGLFEPIEAHNENREKSAVIREQWGIPRDAFHIVSAGELNENKNHIVVIKALAQLQNKNIYYSICGEGDCRDALDEEIQRNGLSDRVILRGYRNDMPEIMKTADLSVFPSIREGMGMAALEAMASGIPLIPKRESYLQRMRCSLFNNFHCSNLRNECGRSMRDCRKTNLFPSNMRLRLQ